MKIKNMIPAVLGAIINGGLENVEIRITFNAEGEMIIKVSPKKEEG